MFQFVVVDMQACSHEEDSSFLKGAGFLNAQCECCVLKIKFGAVRRESIFL